MATKVDPEESIRPINSEIHGKNCYDTFQNDSCHHQTEKDKVLEGSSNHGFDLNDEDQEKFGFSSNSKCEKISAGLLEGNTICSTTLFAKDKHNLIGKNDVTNAEKSDEQNSIAGVKTNHVIDY